MFNTLRIYSKALFQKVEYWATEIVKHKLFCIIDRICNLKKNKNICWIPQKTHHYKREKHKSLYPLDAKFPLFYLQLWQISLPPSSFVLHSVILPFSFDVLLPLVWHTVHERIPKYRYMNVFEMVVKDLICGKKNHQHFQ